MPRAMFFEGFEEADFKTKINTIKICAACEVKAECKEYAESHKDSDGIYGGVFFRDGKPKDPFKIKPRKDKAPKKVGV